MPGDELGGGAGVQDHHRAGADQSGGLTADGVLLGSELQVPLVNGQLSRAGQRDSAIGAGDVPVLVQPTEVASHRGEGDVEPLGDLFHAQCTGFDCLEELQNLLSPLRAADIAATCDQFIVGAFVHGGGSGALPVVLCSSSLTVTDATCAMCASQPYMRKSII